MANNSRIVIRGARENNLRNIDIEIPHGKLIVVTGISGSGKSSLAFDTIAAEARRQYLESLPSFARQYSGKIRIPETDYISGLYPVIAIGQRPPGSSSRSTVGTFSELYDYLRLLFARYGQAGSGIKLSRSLFSFNSPLGACQVCKGLGLEERISLDKLVSDPDLTLREGALSPTLPTGYIMYSQLTMDSLNEVCQAHAFNVDIPWKDLSEEQKEVILYGSDKIKVLKGKHTIESRLKWTALKAKPREYGYYTGMVNIMEDILKRDRNKNILRYTKSVKCSHCSGKRLNSAALTVKYRGNTIDYLCDLELSDLLQLLSGIAAKDDAEKKIIHKMLVQLETLCKLGAGHLSLSRETNSLTGGEAQRIRLVNQLLSDMTRVLYVFDEPSIGMHPRDTKQLITILRTLVAKGNTVLIVEHDPEIIRNADWIIETGPEAGIRGGKVLYNGPAESATAHNAFLSPGEPGRVKSESSYFKLENCRNNILKDISVSFRTASINVITGVPGSGKSSLVYKCLIPLLKNVLHIDHSPIGRTPRSNPATYTGLADHIRDLFAAQDLSKELGYKKGRFSFNNKGGRCEHCQGAGKIQIGMHYMGNVDILCDECKGKRFNKETLEIKYKGLHISDIYNLSINQASEVLKENKTISGYLDVLKHLGLGYLKLGQPSTTLSGGEAQRIKLATALSKNIRKDTWIILDEPTTGLHYADTLVLLNALRTLTSKGNTIVAIEYQEQFIASSDWLIDLGPGSGREGGRLVYEGKPSDFKYCKESITARYIHHPDQPEKIDARPIDNIYISNCRTNNLKGIDVQIPHNKITVITGLSGSGKSSLAFDTIYSEANSRFSENLNTYARSYIKQSNPARADSFLNLTPAVAVDRKNLPVSPRSTVGTMTGVYEKYRYMFSRIAQLDGVSISAQEFSFNHETGACKQCSGLGTELKADPGLLVNDWNLSIAEGALAHNTTIKYYGDPNSQYTALLLEAGRRQGIRINTPLKDYSEKQLDLLFNGSGDKIWNTTWKYKGRTDSGEKEISGMWKGFSVLIEEEYHRRLHNKKLDEIRAMLAEKDCLLCKGKRVNSRALSVKVDGDNIAWLSALSAEETLKWFNKREGRSDNISLIISSIYTYIKPVFDYMLMLGLGHISINRRSSSLSGGEGQRLRLAQQLSGSLCGMTFILDEPSLGLHSRDVGRMIDVIKHLRDEGNTIIMVEHDRQLIKEADYIIEMGPGSGKDGGQLVAQGSYKEFIESKIAISPPFLKEKLLQKAAPREIINDAFGLKGVNKYNLVDSNFSFSAGGLIAITGVSGAGKSTLMHKVLAPSLRTHMPVNCNQLYNNAGFDLYITVDHRALGGGAYSTLASYSGLLDKIASYFATSSGAGKYKMTRQHFLYSSKDGRCDLCKGTGKIKVSLDFIEDIYNTCDACKGRRYKDEVLRVEVSGRNIFDILEMTVDEAIKHFNKSEGKIAGSIINILKGLKEIGLGHLHLGQDTATLSGGEGQRLKLFVKLNKGRGERILFMLDEPSSGLHYIDINNLIKVFNRLAGQGHTVMYIEHNPYLVAVANQVVEL